MKKSRGLRRGLLAAVAALLVLGALGIAGCSCSSTQTVKEDAQTLSNAEDVMYTVPNVVSLTQADAEKSIHSSAMQVGEVKKESSDTVPLGIVISQNPQALTAARANSKVDLVVSSGKPEVKDVKVPDLTGKSQVEAKKELSKVGLIGVPGKPEESTAVKPGLVFKQTIKPGETVKEGSKVGFTTAIAPSQVKVPDVSGKTLDEAKKIITDANLSFDHTEAYNSTIKQGTVATQSIAAGEQVKAGTTVTVTISLGAPPATEVEVPDVLTYSWNDAKAALRSAGLSARYTGDPAGAVVAQDVAPGTKVAVNTLVTVQLATPTEMVDVPDLVGMSVAGAEQATDALGLGLDASYPNGKIVDQWPAAGTRVEVRTVVHVTVQEPDKKKEDVNPDDDKKKDVTPTPDDDTPQPTPDDDTPQPTPDDDTPQPTPDDDTTPQPEPDDGVTPDGDTPDATPDDGGAAPVALISKDDAKRIALKEAKLEESAASKVKVDLKDKDVDEPYFVVDVVEGDTHHFFRINAETGRVLAKVDKDNDKDADPFNGEGKVDSAVD